MKHRHLLKNKRRIVVKIGTSLIAHDNGNINLMRMEKLVRVLADLHNSGREILLVSSGAVGAGMGKMRIREKPSTVVEKQALAAVGQAELLRMYQKFFDEYNLNVGQVLLTRDGLENPGRRKNARNTIKSLVGMQVIPVINENDTVSTDEIEFGDNDRLSAMVANLVQADLLIILTNTNGVYTSNPHQNKDARQVSKVMRAGEDLKDVAFDGSSALGSGGMHSKIEAAELCRQQNIDVVIAEGIDPATIFDILDGKERGTLFVSEATDLQTA
jgi:glutamate 5-kinase